MIEELGQIGNINSFNDLLDFKFSVKTIIILMFLAGSGFILFVILLFGGVNNTVDYLSSIIQSTKIALDKNKNIPSIKFNNSNYSNNSNKKTHDNDVEDDDN